MSELSVNKKATTYKNIVRSRTQKIISITTKVSNEN